VARARPMRPAPTMQIRRVLLTRRGCRWVRCPVRRVPRRVGRPTSVLG
jgi:hypothetical protein